MKRRTMEFLRRIASVVLVLVIVCHASAGAVDQFPANTYRVTVDGLQTVAPLSRFWRSTGFCPPLPHEAFRNYALSDDEIQNIAMIGSVARQGIKQVRIHWLLDLVNVTGESPTALKYDFTDLDTLIDWLHRSQLQPGFEIMGNPSSYFTTFDNKTQVMLWKDLVEQVATRYVTRYGLDEVAEWNFETWNEPSNGDFDTLQVTIPGFMAYYDACSEGLKAVSPRLRLGGPGDGCTTEKPYCWAFLQHCANGTNFFTGETGVRVDFISFHHKGKNTSEYIMNTTNETIDFIRSQYPQLSTVEIYNDEADPEGGWEKLLPWRSDMHYAAMAVKIIAEHQYRFLSRTMAPYTRFALLSNDNGFMNWDPLSHFDERTLTTRFRMNLTQPRSVEMVKKPVLSVMSLLAMLGESQLLVEWKPNIATGILGALASTHSPNASDPIDSWEIVVLLYNSDDTSDDTMGAHIHLEIANAKPPKGSKGTVQMASYEMNNDLTNPHQIWADGGKPIYPSKLQFAAMRRQQEPTISSVRELPPSFFGGSSGGGPVELTFDLALPGVTLVHLCQAAASPPPQAEGLWLDNVTSSEVLVVWHSVQTRCLQTYHVLYSLTGPTGKFSPANEGMIQISTSFIHALSDEDVYSLAQGSGMSISYQIVAVDYSGRPGLPSKPVSIQL